MNKQIKQRVETQTDPTASQESNSEQVPFFVRRLQKLPTFKSGIRGGPACSVDDE
jgi:hypothetical protein